MYEVRKRDGKVVEFDMSKIKQVIIKAFDACERCYQDSIVMSITQKAVADAEKNIKDKVLDVESIQNSVELMLMQFGYEDVAKAYILYRKQHEKIRDSKNVLIDCTKTMKSYLDRSDWRVKENSTVTYSLGGLILGNSGAVTANYWLNDVYDKEIADAHKNCDIHLHDLSMLSCYCMGHSLKNLIQKGIGGVKGKISCAPAKHLSTLCGQMVNFLGMLQNENAG